MRGKHWTAQQFGGRKPKEERTSPDGIEHDSAGEMKRWCRLQMLQREGLISDLERQIAFPLTFHDGTPLRTLRGVSKKTGKPTGGRPITFNLDFSYVNLGLPNHPRGVKVYEEFKGFMAEDAALKIAFVEARYGIQITIVKKP